MVRSTLKRQRNVISIVIITICLKLTKCLCNADSVQSDTTSKKLIYRKLIVNGENAPDKRYSFAQISLMLAVPNDESPYDHQCGGALVAPGVILSAAHCRQWFSQINIDRYDFVDRSDQYEILEASNILVHPNYESATYRYDFMLIQTDTPFSASGIPPVKLNKDPDVPTTGQSVTVFGWGTTDHSDPQNPVFPSVLQKGNLRYITNSDCEETVIANKALYEGEVFSEMLCAKSNRGIDACSGDSGGPLIVAGSEEGEDTLVGIVSWGRGCAIYPGVYSRISSGYDWLRTQICYLSYDPPAYLNCATSERNPTYVSPPTAVPKPPTSTPITAPTTIRPIANFPLPAPSQNIQQSPYATPSRPVSLTDVLPSLSTTTASSPDISQKIAVLVELQLDGNSGETGWYILNEGGQQLYSKPAGTYTDRPTQLVWEIVQLPIGQQFDFVITDTAGNGMCCSDGMTGWFRLSLKIQNNFSTDPTLDKKDSVVPILTGTGSYGSIQSLPFLTDVPSDNDVGGALSRKNDAGSENKEGLSGSTNNESSNGFTTQLSLFSIFLITVFSMYLIL